MDAKMTELLPISLFSSGLSMFKIVQVVMVVLMVVMMVVMTVMDDDGDDGDDDDDLYIIGAVCVSVSKSHYLLGKLFWQVNFFS